jgi:DNA-binding transcriptional ArsR family regulator
VLVALRRAKPASAFWSNFNDLSADSDIRPLVSSLISSAPFRLPAALLPTDLVAKYFRGLGDPIRLRILELLRREGELTVGELVTRLALPQPKVSNHLACLRWCGFVEARREGRTVHNRIADSRVTVMLDLAEALLADNAEHVVACRRIEEPKR